MMILFVLRMNQVIGKSHLKTCPDSNAPFNVKPKVSQGGLGPCVDGAEKLSIFPSLP